LRDGVDGQRKSRDRQAWDVSRASCGGILMGTEVLEVPNVLGGDTQDAEQLFSVVERARAATHYALDMRAVSFVRPYGVIALIAAARLLSARSGHPVRLDNLADQVHPYLHRMDLFDVGCDWLRPASSLDERWARNPHTRNLLELTIVTGPEDVTAVASRARTIFSRWLMVPNLGSLLTILSELCANIYQHSGDRLGCVLIQKYEKVALRQAIVIVAVGDLGRGIRGSLIARHNDLGQEPLDYLHAAMSGKTARNTGRGGLGLRHVEQIAASEGGYLWLRSETAAILSRGPGAVLDFPGLTSVPGTLVTVEFHAPLRT